MAHPDDRYTDLYHRATSRALREVADDLDVGGRIPSDEITCFGDLHSHVDANEYGGLTDDNAVDVSDPADMGIANAVQSTVSVVLHLTRDLYPDARVRWLRTAAEHLDDSYTGLVPRPPAQTDIDRANITELAHKIADILARSHGPFDPEKVWAELHEGEMHYDLGGMASMMIDDVTSESNSDLAHAAARVAFAILAEGHVTTRKG